MIERRECLVGRVEETFDRRVWTLDAGPTWTAHAPGVVVVTMMIFETDDAAGGEDMLRGLIAASPGQHGIIYERQAWRSFEGGVHGRYGLVVWERT